MKVPRIATWCIVVTMLVICISLGFDKAIALQRGPPSADEGAEILTRGPVHEAFAETVTFDPEPGLIAPQSPPEAIEESPPDQRPEGANVAWIPGYWAWDDERTDFLWVSGIWRAIPPGRQWVPGYWARAGQQGAQWTSGYWADVNASEIDYLPEPPATVEAGPNTAAPSPDHAWLPGCWLWQQNRYAWRPGLWAAGQSDWDWIPAHYVWTPRGHVFVDGYYDYTVARRGVLFAPVYFSPSIYSRRGFSYSPVTVINPAVFASHLFLRPSYGHYYFGDYYGANYSTRGYSSWFSFYSTRSGYDPFYAQQRWQHRSDRDWDRRVQADYAHRRDHEDARPPRTWAAQRDRGQRAPPGGDKSFVVAASLSELASSKNNSYRFQPVAPQEREQIGQRGQEVRSARDERQRLEAAGLDPTPDSSVRTVKPVKVKLPRMPIASPPADRLGAGHAPPRAFEAPQPDPSIEPRPRTPRGSPGSPQGDPRVPNVVLKPVPGPDQKPTPQAEPGPTPRVDPKPTPRTDPSPMPRIEPKPAPRDEPKPMPRIDPKPTPRTDPSPMPRIEPKPVPRDEPKPMPRIEPKPTPRVDPRPMPRIEPKPVPRDEPKPKPRSEPKPMPRAEPKPDRPSPPKEKPPRDSRGGSGDRPNGGAKESPSGGGNNKPRN